MCYIKFGEYKNIRSQLIIIFFVVLIGMTIYEVTKQLILPNIGIWESHIITIIFTTILATIGAYFVLNERENLINKYVTEKNRYKEAEKEYRTIFENTGTATVIIEEDTTISLANHEFEKISGYGKKEIENVMKWIDFIAKEDLEKMLKYHKQRREKGQIPPRTYEAHFIDRYGNMKNVIFTVSLIPGTKKSVASLLDITERKRIEEALKESEEKFREVFNNANDAMFLHEVNENGLPGTFIEVNDIASKRLGYSREELLKMSPMDIDAIGEEMWPPVMDKLFEIGDITFEGLHLSKDGLKIPVEISSHIFILNNERVVLSIARDITERKIAQEEMEELLNTLELRVKDRTIELEEAYQSLRESELKFRTLAENSPDIITRCDKNLKITYFSKDSEDLGLSRDDFIGKKIDDLKIDDDLKYLWIEKVLDAFSTCENQEFEYKFYGSKGVRYSQAIITPEYDDKGKIETCIGIIRDITKRKLVENALRESEEKFRTLAENSPAIIYRFELVPERCFSYINPVVTSITGYTPEEHYSDPDLGFKLVCDEDKHFLDEVSRGIFKNPLVLRWVRKDGEIIWTEQYNAPVYNDNGEIVAIQGIVFDITERIEIEKSLERSEAKYKELVENANSSIIRLDKNGCITFFNEFAEKFFGFSKEEILGKNVIGTIVPETESSGRDLKKLIDRIIDNPEAYYYVENENMRKNGERVWVSWTNKGIYNENGELAGILSIGINITELKKARESIENERNRLFKVLDLIPAFLYLQAPDYSIKFVNNEFKKRFGEPEDGKFYDVIHDCQEPNKPCPSFKVFETKNPQSWEWTDNKGRNYIVYDYPFPSFNEEELVLEVGIDVTELKNTERKLKRTIAELERSNDELRQFAYITSHDLQEPLRSIASYAQLIDRRYKGKLDSDADEFLDFMVEGAIRMKTMIQGLLEYSKIGKGDEFKPTNIENVLTQVLANLNATINENNAIITHDQLPIVTADSRQLIQVFQNLIGNAIKFRKKDETPKIHISTKKINNEHLFSVSDNSIGMEQQYTAKIFELFKRLHTIDKYSGSGIGLAIVKRIIDRHGGRIWVESKYGKGSTFYFTIPIKEGKRMNLK